MLRGLMVRQFKCFTTKALQSPHLGTHHILDLCVEKVIAIEVGIRDPYFAIFVTPLREHLVDKRHILSYISEFVCQTEKKKERED